MGLLFIVQTAIRNLELLGAMYGLVNIPKPDRLPIITWITVLIVGFIVYRLDNSRLGRAMETSFVDRSLADTEGINRYWFGVFIQTIAGAIGGLAGSYYAFTIAALRPDHFNFAIILRLIVFVFVGGCQTMWGIVIFTPILWAVAAFVPSEIAAWREMIFGALLILILLVRPEGVIDRQLLRAIGNKIRQWRGREPIGIIK
jgi:branched-chain amino acid transport system permease protein